jgi:hypothetical protein
VWSLGVLWGCGGGEYGGKVAALLREAVGNVGCKEVRLGEVGVELVQLGGERIHVLGGEGDVAALQWLAACEVGHCLIALGGELASAEGLFGVVDASDEVTKVDMGVLRGA